MKGYHEYLELHGYFAKRGQGRLSQREFVAADREWKELANQVRELTTQEQARLRELKALLFRDRP